MNDPHELPMVVGGCTLTTEALGTQAARYRALGETVARSARSEAGLTIWFEDTVDVALLKETIAIERGCCSFLRLDYDTSERRLSITLEDPERRELLELIASALGSAARSSAR